LKYYIESNLFAEETFAISRILAKTTKVYYFR